MEPNRWQCRGKRRPCLAGGTAHSTSSTLQRRGFISSCLLISLPIERHDFCLKPRRVEIFVRSRVHYLEESIDDKWNQRWLVYWVLLTPLTDLFVSSHSCTPCTSCPRIHRHCRSNPSAECGSIGPIGQRLR